MRTFLVDTNVLLRIPKRSDPHHLVVDHALSTFAIQGVTLYYTHQNIAEFWNTMTRPQSRNGFGLTVQDADREQQTKGKTPSQAGELGARFAF